MTSRRTAAWLGGVGLVALGAAGAFAVSHVRVQISGPVAHAAPGVAAEIKPALPPPTAAAVSDARALSRTFAQVAAQLSPSVVRITMGKTIKAPRQGQFRGLPFGFGPQGQPGFGGNDEDDEMPAPGRGNKQHGEGSGVVIDTHGHILTNNHVVAGADELKVTFLGGRTAPAKIVGTDPKTDLAVIEVTGVKDLVPAKLGDSDKLLIGEWVIAIGNPFGLDHTVTVGVLSAKGRAGVTRGNFEDFLQTDASINPGNSGGPLVNLDGEVIGINTAIFSPGGGFGGGSGGNIGIGFAVPSALAKPISEQLIAGGKVRRPFLGISMQDITPELQRALGQAAPEKGAIVAELTKDAPAARAGVKAGDIIVAIDGKAVENGHTVQREVFTKKIGQSIQLALWREGKQVQLVATAAEMPGEAGEEGTAPAGVDKERESPKAKLGLTLQSLSPDIAQQLRVPTGMRGVVVGAVRPDSPAAEVGLSRGDVIVEVDHRPVGSVAEVNGLLNQRRGAESGHLLRILRGGMSSFVALP